VGHLDEAGYLYLTGRATEMIVSGSVNIYPGEIEGVLLRHPAVTGAAVIGIADHEFGERPAAVVETRPGTLDPAQAARELERHCRGLLAGFKVPRRYRVVASLPRDATGKVRKAALREDWARWEREGAGEC
jgi:acyl-CoA synthetase (AMP-forming)/AMP-acid ligase II